MGAGRSSVVVANMTMEIAHQGAKAIAKNTLIKAATSKATWAATAILTVGELAYWTYRRYGSSNPISPALYKERVKMTLLNNGFAIVGGLAGAAGGAYIGAFVGAWFGPLGLAIGGVIGGIIGGTGGGVAGTMISNALFANHELVEAEI